MTGFKKKTLKTEVDVRRHDWVQEKDIEDKEYIILLN